MIWTALEYVDGFPLFILLGVAFWATRGERNAED